MAIPALALALGASAAHGAAAPSLRLVAKNPLTVTGLGFLPSERVTLTVLATKHVLRQFEARRDGSFHLAFPGVRVGACTGARVIAVGGKGSRAQVWMPRPMCLPVPKPAPRP
jgi:hypothetical protein